MCLLGNFSEKKQHRNAYAQGSLSEKGNFSSASYYISHPVERTFAADRTNVKTLTHRWHYLRRKGNATIFLNPSVSVYIFNYLQLCVKNIFKIVLGTFFPETIDR